MNNIDLLKNQDQSKPKFTILLPPPNITGSLHIGHFFNWSLQDLLIRHKYSKNYYVNWVVGIDHAGISAQYVVERELMKENKTKDDLGKEAFVQKIFEWKNTAENLIANQAEKFELMMDWSKKRFTMDDDYKKIVINSFKKLFDDGLIEKKLKATNWDVKFQTALSDLEIIDKKEKTKMYKIEYKCTDGINSIKIGTTRPETLFADAAIAVNPLDERYKHLHNKTFFVPIINKAVPLIIDSRVEMEKGTGCLKIDPAHAILDFEIGTDYNLEMIQIIDKKGNMINIGPEFDGLNRFEARKKTIEILKKENLIEEEDWEGIVQYTEKSGELVETILTNQWFLDVSKMAAVALEKSEEMKFFPENLRNVFKQWLENIKPWCISRQIWWGHQIPIWYKNDGTFVCANSYEEAVLIANTNELIQESDVLDTWFSSALWPIATDSDNISDVLITGKDILFFWVARMVMFSLYFQNKLPFKSVYFNGIIRDANNSKMSKTKGNVIDPIELNEKYGKDALRFTLLKKSANNKDIQLNENEIIDARSFITKIKNATKFINEFMSQEFNENEELNNWIEEKILNAAIKIDEDIENFEFQAACEKIYELMWDDFCCWYIEGLKKHPSKKAKLFLCAILKIMHPIIPFITQECYESLNKSCNINDFKFEFSIKKSKFEETIAACKFLRKLKKNSELTSFFANKDIQLISHYTKLEIDEASQNFRMNFNGIEIKIKKEFAESNYELIKKEYEKELELVKNFEEKIKNANNVPEIIIKEWSDRLKNLNINIKILEQWLNTLS